MNWDTFADWGKKIAQWGANYHGSLRDRPVRAQVQPGSITALIDQSPPETGVDMQTLMADFERIVMPGMTHWQHPRFFAYFPANAAPESILAEYISSTMAAQCMLWQTSPAATEMETCMIDWLRQAIGLPQDFSGVIQDSASGATLAAVLTMRERAVSWQGNSEGLSALPKMRIYCSTEVHSSIDRAVWIAGIGGDNIVRVPISGAMRSMNPNALRAAIERDLADGLLPIGVIACTGATGVGACDDLTQVLDIAREFNLYSHVDAAWAGSAMICPEFRTLWSGVEQADSVVFNPHKWLGAQFDCSAHFLRSPDDLVKTLAIQPEYLKTHGKNGLINYSEWSVPLGRRFRALKLWFLIRSYGLEGLRTRLRNHVAWSQALANRLKNTDGVELMSAPVLSLFSFRVHPKNGQDIDTFNQNLVDAINDDGRIYITQSLLDGQKVIRFQAGQFDCTEDDIQMAYDVILEIAQKLEA